MAKRKHTFCGLSIILVLLVGFVKVATSLDRCCFGRNFMRIRFGVFAGVGLMGLMGWGLVARGEDVGEAVREVLRQYVNEEGKSTGVVVGMVDEHGMRVVSVGKSGNTAPGRDGLDGDTVF